VDEIIIQKMEYKAIASSWKYFKWVYMYSL
jgi:hypothetical protein